ncbi:MAG: hypothetical protein ACRD2W_18305 [Acidimicrobiales bacterium]
MAGRIGNVQIGCGSGPAYQREGGALARLYGELLGMTRYDPGYIKLGGPTGRRVSADPIGHPFCLCPAPAADADGQGGPPGRIARIVFDCPTPRRCPLLRGAPRRMARRSAPADPGRDRRGPP